MACRAVVCAALWIDPVMVCCITAAKLITEFARKATATPLGKSCSQISFGRWLALSRPDGALDAADPNHLNVLRFALLDFIADFANWDNSTQADYLTTARALTQAAHEALGGAPRTRPLVADPFAGGGTIPLEALRVGADAFASDLNPVAVLLNKVVLNIYPNMETPNFKYRMTKAKKVFLLSRGGALLGQLIKDKLEEEWRSFIRRMRWHYADCLFMSWTIRRKRFHFGSAVDAQLWLVKGKAHRV